MCEVYDGQSHWKPLVVSHESWRIITKFKPGAGTITEPKNEL